MIRSLIIVLLVFFCQNAFCQEYHFDRLVKYRETNDIYTGHRFIEVYLNSKNTSYYLINRSWNNEIDTYLVDNNTNTTHNFYIEDFSKIKEYVYFNSRKFNPDNCEIDCSKESIDEIKNSGQFTKIIYSQYTTKKKKRKDYDIEVIVKPTDFVCLKPLIKILQHHFLFCEELKTSDNSIPVSTKFIKGKKVFSEQKLEASSNIKMDFSVKKESIKYTTTH